LSKEGEDVLVFVLPCLDVIVYEWYLTDGLAILAEILAEIPKNSGENDPKLI